MFISFEYRDDVRRIVGVHRVEIHGLRHRYGLAHCEKSAVAFQCGQIARGYGFICARCRRTGLIRPADKRGAGGTRRCFGNGRRNVRAIPVPIGAGIGIFHTRFGGYDRALHIVEQHLGLVRRDKQIVVGKAVIAAGVVGDVFRKRVVRRVFLHAFSGIHGLVVGFPIEPRSVFVDGVRGHTAFAEPPHEAIPLVGVARNRRIFRGGFLHERHGRVAFRKPLRRAGQNRRDGEGIGVARRLVFAELGRFNGHVASTGEIQGGLHAFAMHGNTQLVIHDPLVHMASVAGGARNASREIVIVAFP